METMTITLPDNWHAHLRQDEMMLLIHHYFDIYGRVLCMGNTNPLIETGNQAREYEKQIRLLDGFTPVVCIMLTNKTTPKIIYDAASQGIKFVKFIPVGTSTGAVRGLRLDDYDNLSPLFSAITDAGMHLLVHAELISDGDMIIPFIHREEMAFQFIKDYRKMFPGMKITIEHASTDRMINFVRRSESANLRATLTPHHAALDYYSLRMTSEDKPLDLLNHCLPVVKTGVDKRAVIEAMTSGDERFFHGSDAAAHLWVNKLKKMSPGIFLGDAEIPLLVEIFEREGELPKLENFTSRFGAEYYGFPLNEEKLILGEETWEQPIEKDGIRLCMGGQLFEWQVLERIQLTEFIRN